MNARIDVITLAVDDLDRSLVFYRDGLGLKTQGVIATEFPGDEVNAAGAVVMFELEGGLTLALYPRREGDLGAPVRIRPRFLLGRGRRGRARPRALAATAGGRCLFRHPARLRDGDRVRRPPGRSVAAPPALRGGCGSPGDRLPGRLH